MTDLDDQGPARTTAQPTATLETQRREATRRVGRYRILGYLGGGGMGEVYGAHDDVLERPVAIKQLRSDWEATEGRRRQLAVEAQLNARLSHPHVVRVYDFVTSDKLDYIVTEYVEGQSLYALRQAGPLATVRALALLTDVANGLAAAHQAGIVHGDLKLENVLVSAEGGKVADFGIARVVGQPTREIIGTRVAMSPEQLAGKEADVRSDVFSFGILAYELFAGHPPHKIREQGEGSRRAFLPLVEVAPHTPLELSKLVDRCLDTRVELRPAHGGELHAQMTVMLTRASNELAADAGAAPTALRRQVAIVFARRASVTTEIDENVRQLAIWQANVESLVLRAQAHLIAITDEEAMVCVGYPFSHADNSRRAAEIARSIVGMGIPTSAAIDVGFVGVVEQGKRVVMAGPPLRGAAEVGRSAAAGRILVTARAHALLARNYELVLERDASSPGVLLYSLGATLDVAPGDAAPKLIGRDQDIEALARFEREALEGTGDRTLQLVGDAGVGKSSLVRAFLYRSSSARRLVVQGDERLQYTPFGAFKELLGRLPELRGADGRVDREAVQRTSLELGGYEATAAVLTHVLGLATPEDEARIAAVPSDERHTLLASYLAEFLIGMFAKTTSTVVIEDMHWLDSASVETTRALARSRGERLAILITNRPYFTLTSAPMHTLRTLSDSMARELVTERAGDVVLPAGLLNGIIGNAGGLPLLLDELTRFVTERLAAGGKMRMLDITQIPTTHQDSLAERLQSLSASTRRVAQLAAAIGLAVDLSLLRRSSVHLANDPTVPIVESELDAHLAALHDEGILEVVSERVTFRHALTRQVAYDSQEPPLRVRSHRAILAEIDAGFAHWREQRPELVAMQCDGAGEVQRAAESWMAAGKRAMEEWFPTVAEDHFSAALRSIAAAPAEDWRRETELDIRRARSSALSTTFGWSSHELNENNAAIWELCRKSGESIPDWASIYHSLSMAYVVGDEAGLSAMLGLLAREAARAEGPEASLIRYNLHSTRGLVHVHHGYLRQAKEDMEVALALRPGLMPTLRSFPLPEPMILPGSTMAWVHVLENRVDDAWKTMRETEDMFERGTREHLTAASFCSSVALAARFWEEARSRVEYVLAHPSTQTQLTGLAEMTLAALALRDLSTTGEPSRQAVDDLVRRMASGYESWQANTMRAGCVLFMCVQVEPLIEVARQRAGTEASEASAAHARNIIQRLLPLVAEENPLDRYYVSEVFRLNALLLEHENQHGAAATARAEAMRRANLLQPTAEDVTFTLSSRIEEPSAYA